MNCGCLGFLQTRIPLVWNLSIVRSIWLQRQVVMRAWFARHERPGVSAWRARLNWRGINRGWGVLGTCFSVAIVIQFSTATSLPRRSRCACFASYITAVSDLFLMLFSLSLSRETVMVQAIRVSVAVSLSSQRRRFFVKTVVVASRHFTGFSRGYAGGRTSAGA